MLEFIVLGQIPGTHFQITFAWFALGLLAGLIWVDYKIHRSHKHAGRSRKVEVIHPNQV